jgi:hypothetical protein
MTAHVLGLTDSGPGVKGSRKPVFSHGGKPLEFAVFDYNMGTDNYAVNGNDIAGCWDKTKGGFTTVLYIGIEQMDTSTEADRREFTVDYTAKTLIQYDAFNSEETATDQGVVTVRLLVVGYN